MSPATRAAFFRSSPTLELRISLGGSEEFVGWLGVDEGYGAVFAGVGGGSLLVMGG